MPPSLEPLGKYVEKSPKGHPSKFGLDSFRYIDISSVDGKAGRILDCRTITAEDAPSRARKLVRTGNLIISTVRPNLKGTALIPEELDGMIASTGFSVISTTKGLDAEYLYFIARSDLFVDRLMARAKGASYPAVTEKDIFEIEIPVPSLPEQKRIVDILKRAEGIVRLRKEQLEKTRALIPALFIDMFGDPATNPMKWDKKRLSNVCDFRGGGTPSKSIKEYWDGEIPWVSPKDMKQQDLFDTIDHISVEATNNTVAKLMPAGSVVIVVRSGILKHTFPCAILRKDMSINQDMKALLPRHIISEFLLHQLLFLSPVVLRSVRLGATVHNLDTNFLKNLELIIPPEEKQNDFVIEVNQIRETEVLQTHSLKKQEALFQSLLHGAFNGEL